MFGGYNFLMFGDTHQLPPIPSKAALFIPPSEKKTHAARQALDIFWSSGPDALNFFYELEIQMRVDDVWFNAVLQECREGDLSEEMYNFSWAFQLDMLVHDYHRMLMVVREFCAGKLSARSFR